MRTLLLGLAALAACAIDERKVGPAATAAVPDTAEWFLTEFGYRIPPKDTAEFLECTGGGFSRVLGIEYLTERCLPLSAVPPEGLRFCRDQRYQAPASRTHPDATPLGAPHWRWNYYCPDAPEGTPVRVVTAADLAWIRSTLSGNTIALHRDDPDRGALGAKSQGTRVR